MTKRVKHNDHKLIQQNLERLAGVTVHLSVEVARMRMPLKQVIAMSDDDAAVFKDSAGGPMILRVGEAVIGTCDLVTDSNGKPAIRILTIKDSHTLSGLERVG